MKKTLVLFGILATLAYGNYAFADSKITDLTAVTAAALTDVLPEVQSGTDYKITLQKIHDLLLGSTATFSTTAGVTYTLCGTSCTFLSSTTSGVQTFLTTPLSANFFSMVTDETGSGAVVGGTNPTITGPAYAAYASSGTTDQGTKNINIDGASYSRYLYSPLAGTAAVYTPVITSAPGAGTVRYIELVLGGGTNGVTTITWTNVDAIGTAFATSVAATKYSHYACMIPTSGHAQCAIIAEGSTY